jgi:hypothetical protein
MLNKVKEPIIEIYMEDDDTLSGNIDKEVSAEQILGTIELLLLDLDRLGISKEIVLRYLQK